MVIFKKENPQISLFAEQPNNQPLFAITFISFKIKTISRFILFAECPALRSSLLNGFMIGSGSVEGSVYHFRCRKGYFRVGAKVLYCSGQGRWNGSLPNCFIGMIFINDKKLITLCGSLSIMSTLIKNRNSNLNI